MPRCGIIVFDQNNGPSRRAMLDASERECTIGASTLYYDATTTCHVMIPLVFTVCTSLACTSRCVRFESVAVIVVEVQLTALEDVLVFLLWQF